MPSFPETSSPQLDEVLLQLRTKHFIPAYLNKRQRHLIFGDKFKTELQNNPAYATLGDEEIALVHIDRTREIPARKPLVLQALGLIEENDEWNQLPSLLEGLHKAHPDSDPALQEKILRKLQQADQFSVILRCLRRSETTGLTLKKDAVLNRVLLALRETALGEKWEQERLEKALRHADELAELLESAQHGTMRQLSPNDPRTRPAVIGLFLELHAVYASQYQGGQDVKGKVRAYAQRFMACFDHANQVSTPLAAQCTLLTRRRSPRNKSFPRSARPSSSSPRCPSTTPCSSPPRSSAPTCLTPNAPTRLSRTTSRDSTPWRKPCQRGSRIPTASPPPVCGNGPPVWLEAFLAFVTSSSPLISNSKTSSPRFLLSPASPFRGTCTVRPSRLLQDLRVLYTYIFMSQCVHTTSPSTCACNTSPTVHTVATSSSTFPIPSFLLFSLLKASSSFFASKSSPNRCTPYSEMTSITVGFSVLRLFLPRNPDFLEVPVLALLS